jgi:hypothetical protein
LGNEAGEMSDNMNDYSNERNNVENGHHIMERSQQGNIDCSHLSKIYDCNLNSSNHHCNLGSSRAISIFNVNNDKTSNNNFDNGSVNSNCSNFKGKLINTNKTSERILTDSNINLTESLPPDWIALEDTDSGEMYYANEVTGESTWDKPTLQQTVTKDKDFDDNLAPEWIALEDANSGETYYLNQLTMATTWHRPSEGNGSETEATDGEQQSSENSGLIDHNGDLPPGWEALLDPSSGDYYFAHESGETQWELPKFDQPNYDVADDKSGEQGRSEGNYSIALPLDENLLPGWFSAIDEDSGDQYYCNEVTGETTWDIPTTSAVADD